MTRGTRLLLLYCCLLTTRLFAQPDDYLFSRVDVTAGLSSNYITAIYKDTRGFMWFGTISGLNRYDGYQFRVFKHDPRNPHSIFDNYIEQIFEGPGGRMWVESRHQRFAIYDAALDRFDLDYGAYQMSLGLPPTPLRTIVPSAKGYWFIYRDSGIYHYINPSPTTTPAVTSAAPSPTTTPAVTSAAPSPTTTPAVTSAAPAPADAPVRVRGLSPSPIVNASEDPHGDCWVLHENGLLEKIDGLTHRVTFRTPILTKDFGSKPITYSSLYIDAQNDLWICSNGTFKGVFFYHPATGQLRHLAMDAGERLLSSNIIQATLQDRKGRIWLATDHGGVDILDKRDFSVQFVTHVGDDGKSIAENSVTSLYGDSLGTIWLGTYKSGISYCHQDNFQFPLFRADPRHPGMLSYDDINNFVEDAAGNIWIAANGGGLIYWDRKKNVFRQYLHDPRNPNSICSNILVSLLLDKGGKLWIGTYFGGLDCFDGKTFTHYRHRDDDPYSLADDRVMCLCEDAEGQLWVGTMAAGMDRLDRRRKVFYHYRSSLPNSIHNDYVSSIITDAHDNLWVGTGYGIDMIEKNTGDIYHFSTQNSQLSSGNATWLFMDSQHRLWAGTREGLDVLNPDGKTFQSFTTEDGLPDNTIRDIQEDSLHRLWVSTTNGLSRITVYAPKDRSLRIRCRNFREQDGLQGREFNERAGLATRDGLLLFGGPDGFNFFRPDEVAPDRKAPPIVLTALQVFDRTVHVGDTTSGHVILGKAISETPGITLNYHENVFSIEFASLGFIGYANNKYAYTLDGFNNKWLMTDGRIRKATYTNLDAGTYTFRVRATDDDGQWYDREAALRITVLPPWWKTPWAYTAYVLLLAASLWLWRRFTIQRARMRFALENERREARRMHEMDLMKIRFFTNMSHELRTPLSLILAGLDPHTTRHADPRPHYDMIRRNARRLLHLVNQLLDFRKMEVNELKLHLRESDVMKFVREISLSFVDLAERKNISFTYNAHRQSLVTSFDPDKLERILFNLLSNAFKFTPENGSVSVTVDTRDQTPNPPYYSPQPASSNPPYHPPQPASSNPPYHPPQAASPNPPHYPPQPEGGDVLLSIRIADTGIGIPADKLEKIFERFFQHEVPNAIVNQGSGIGLSITQEFVRMHNGRLSVESEVDKGSCFTVELPFRQLTPSLAPAIPPPPPVTTTPSPMPLTTTQSPPPVTTTPSGAPKILDIPPPPASAPTILIVEDNEDFRFYLKDNLRAQYHIVEASDGNEGWKKVLSAHPVLVVSDISMPHMDGIELCRKIRNDPRTKQIPVILLTAMTGESVELQGLQTGATDYITKPFNFEVLLSKIRNIVQHHETVKKTYQRQVQAAPSPVETTSADELFLRDVLANIEKEIGNPDLSVEALSAMFHTSRSTFYKRLVLLTGKTPVEFIRHIRLKRAAELLGKSQLTVAEIAYTVGFNNPKYFTQYFKAEYGCIPSAYRSRNRTQIGR